MLGVFMCIYQNLVLVAECTLIVDTHCSDVCSDEFQVPQIDRKSKQVKNSVLQILFAIGMGKTRCVKH